MSTTTNPSVKVQSLRKHPRLAPIFTDAESRHFKDEELAAIVAELPELEPLAETCKVIRSKDVAIINKVVKEVFSQYDYEKHHDFASAKCPRDVRYVVTYACAAMLARDPQWLEDKLLIWLKTILQAFEFPARKPGAGGALFSDKALEDKLAKLPKKTQSIYHCYYRLRQEMEKELGPEHFSRIEPYLTSALNVLTEEY
jgi:hypothetical protein